VAGTFIGKDKDKTVPANLEEYARVWPPIVQFAAENGVKFGYVVSIEHENCDFEKIEELVKNGFLIACDVLRPYIK